MSLKFPFSRFLALLTMVSIGITSCTAAPSAVPTQITTATLTLVPKSTATPEASPTPTKDPNAPAEFTRHENGTYYLDVKTEKGNTLTYTYDTERKSYYRPIFSGFVLDYTQEINNTAMKQPDQLLLNMFVDKSINGELLLPTLSHNSNMDPMNAINFTALFDTDLTNALLDRKIINVRNDANFAGWNAKKLYLDFTNADGPQRLGLWPGATMSVHIRADYDALKVNMATNGFSETKKSTIYGPANSYMIKIWTDKNGNGYVDIAPSLSALQWTEAMFNQMGFIGFGDIFDYSNLRHPESGRITAEFSLNQKNYHTSHSGLHNNSSDVSCIFL